MRFPAYIHVKLSVADILIGSWTLSSMFNSRVNQYATKVLIILKRKSALKRQKINSLLTASTVKGNQHFEAVSKHILISSSKLDYKMGLILGKFLDAKTNIHTIISWTCCVLPECGKCWQVISGRVPTGVHVVMKGSEV